MPNTAKKLGKNGTATFIKAANSKQVVYFLELLKIDDNASHTRAVAVAGELMDIIGDNPDDPRYRMIDLLADAIGSYEDKIYPPIESNPVGVLRFLMEAQGVKQVDLADIFGSQGNVSQILNGQRELNSLEHIRKLAERLHVDPAVFL
jgi:HTH-type transcriptional regulator/antitoxin HigA